MLNPDVKFALSALGWVGATLIILMMIVLWRGPADPLPVPPTPVRSLESGEPEAEPDLVTTDSVTATRSFSTTAPLTPTSTTTTTTGQLALAPAATASKLTGSVIDENGPVAGATVRVQLATESVRSATDGTFTLTTVEPAFPFTVTAWASGYYIGSTIAQAPDEPIQIHLTPYYTTDNFTYGWFEQDGIDGSAACGICHTAYPEWQQDAHSQTATNYRFLTLYSGTDVHGNESPRTGYTSDGKFALPDPDHPYYGPGFKLDNPDRAGNCATCHTPMAAKIPTTDGCSWSGCHSSTVAQFSDEIQTGASPRYLLGDAEEGISCEFCHKVSDIRLDENRLPYSNSPGILSMVLLRPEKGDDLFFGTLDDVVRTDIPETRDSYLPLLAESEFCASCHYGIMGGVVGPRSMTGGELVYGSYAEWLASPYSDPEDGRSCQDCHMPRVTYDRFVFPSKGGRVRDYHQISNHTMLGPNDEDFLQSAAALDVATVLDGSELAIDVTITNSGGGHHIPTGTPIRQLILVVTATDANGTLLALQDGPLLPEWAGDYADQPGKFFAKILRDKLTGEAPTTSYWREIELVEDTRIPALATDTSRYQFVAPETDVVTVEVQLLYRRAYQTMMEQKDWPDPDIVIAQQQITINE